METNLTQSGDVKILNIAGSLDTNTAPELENEVNAILDTKVERLIFDLKDLAYVSSSGLRVFLMTAKKLMPNKGKLYLAAPNDTVKEILKVSGFDSIIPVSKDVEEALEKINVWPIARHLLQIEVQKAGPLVGEFKGMKTKFFGQVNTCIYPNRFLWRAIYFWTVGRDVAASAAPAKAITANMAQEEQRKSPG